MLKKANEKMKERNPQMAEELKSTENLKGMKQLLLFCKGHDMFENYVKKGKKKSTDLEDLIDQEKVVFPDGLINKN